MKTHRIWTIATLFWFFALFNIERVFPEIDIASFVYGLCTLVGVCMLAFPALRRQNFGVVTAIFGMLWILGKCVLGYGVTLDSLPISLVEAYSLVISQFLCLKVAQNTEEFEIASGQMLEVLKATSVPDLKQSEGVMLEEIRRARRHERPLTFISLTPGIVRQEALAALIQKLTDSLSKEYVVGGISRVLRRDTKTHDLAVRVDDQILMLLPETNTHQAEQMVARIKTRVQEDIGVPMTSEVYAFGVDEVTLSGVLDRMGVPPLDSRRPSADIFELHGLRPDAENDNKKSARASGV